MRKKEEKQEQAIYRANTPEEKARMDMIIMQMNLARDIKKIQKTLDEIQYHLYLQDKIKKPIRILR